MRRTWQVPATLDKAVDRCKEIDNLLAAPLTDERRNSLNWELASIIATWVKR